MGRDASRRRADRALTVPFGRQGTGWEVAYAALFLISNESSYVNAHTLFLDGGHLGGIVRGWDAIGRELPVLPRTPAMPTSIPPATYRIRKK